jgi:hypothetical protein
MGFFPLNKERTIHRAAKKYALFCFLGYLQKYCLQNVAKISNRNLFNSLERGVGLHGHGCHSNHQKNIRQKLYERKIICKIVPLNVVLSCCCFFFLKDISNFTTLFLHRSCNSHGSHLMVPMPMKPHIILIIEFNEL